MDFKPKPISKDGIAAALQKAERYRLSTIPPAAESICLDVLAVSPENQQALVTLLLAITDQFGEAPTEGVRRARQVLPRLRGRIQARLLRGHHLRAVRQGAAAVRLPRRGRDGVSLVPRGDELVREGRVPAARRQRRSDPALEHLRPAAGAEPAPEAWSGGTGDPEPRSEAS